jgi:hypothetical protein
LFTFFISYPSAYAVKFFTIAMHNKLACFGLKDASKASLELTCPKGRLSVLLSDFRLGKNSVKDKRTSLLY